jgi:hypothetical protein
VPGTLKQVDKAILIESWKFGADEPSILSCYNLVLETAITSRAINHLNLLFQSASSGNSYQRYAVMAIRVDH